MQATRTYIGPTAREIADRLPGSGRQDHEGRFRLRGWCHGHGERTDSASLVLQDRRNDLGLSVKCWAGCERRDIIAALEAATGLTIWDAWDRVSGGHDTRFSLPSRREDQPAPEKPRKSRHSDFRKTFHIRLWGNSAPIPVDPEHPARRWIERRRLWRSTLPVPGCLRWLPADQRHTGAGSIIALAAPPKAWSEAWPELPAPQAVQLIAIDVDGKPALDRPAEEGGTEKRSHGPIIGAVIVFGNPVITDANLGPVRVAEGIADALALSSRFPGNAVATLGTVNMTQAALATWLRAAPLGVVVHADDDEPKQGQPAGGTRAARALCRSVKELGGNARAVLPPRGKDAAAAANLLPFAPLDEAWTDYARGLRETTNWPRWEIAREATTLYANEGSET